MQNAECRHFCTETVWVKNAGLHPALANSSRVPRALPEGQSADNVRDLFVGRQFLLKAIRG
jgi:hypothetical protein